MVGRPTLRIVFLCLALFIAGTVQGIRTGWHAGAFALVVGSIASRGAVFVYGRGIGKPPAAAVLADLVPYLFGCYVRDKWNGRAAVSSFSLSGRLEMAAFV